MQTEDRQIIAQCLNGDSAMFGFLVEKYKEGVYALAYSRLHNFHDAQDIAQEAFIKAYRKLHTLKHWDNFALWLSAITNNLCKNFIRSKSRRPDRELADEQSQEIIDHTSVNSYRESLADESLKEALDSLPLIYRQVLVLHYLSGYTSMDISHLLGISVRTVAERLRVGRERLKEEMVNMMSATLKEQRLPAGFTFKIVEMVKKIRINPITQSKSLPWGLSLATGIIITIFCLNPYMSYFSHIDTPAGAPLPSETKVLKTGEIPVDILKTDQIMVISSKVEKGKGEEAQKNTLFLAPQDEGGEWVKKADMPTARYGLCTAAVNGKIYAIGGRPNANSVLSNVEEYDPIKDNWEIKSRMPQAKAFLSASSANGKIYVFGGYNAGVAYASVHEYDPVLDKWTAKKDMPKGLYYCDSCALDSKIYVMGGFTWANNEGDTNVLYEYDPIKDSWIERANMPSKIHAMKALPVNGKIYVIGGAFWDMVGIPKPFSTVEEYDPVTDTWEKKSDMPTPRAAFAACVVGTKIYAMGGSKTLMDVGMDNVEIYDTLTDSWTKGVNMPGRRWLSYANVIGEKIYSIGRNGNNDSSIVEEFDTGFISKSVDLNGKFPKTWGKIKGR